MSITQECCLCYTFWRIQRRPLAVHQQVVFCIQECYNLTDIIIPNSVTDIGIASFYSCIKFTIFIISTIFIVIVLQVLNTIKSTCI